MADICACCGKKIPFLDVDYDYIGINKEEYRLCRKCRNIINSYNAGNISVDEVITDATNGNVADYLRNIKSEKDIEHKRQENERIDPLYDDIHQIAGDLRFIKNLIIIGLVCGFVLGIIGVLGML